MKIVLGADHGGLVLKESVKKAVLEAGFDYEDLGTFTEASVDYPDYAEKVARHLLAGKADRGILLCGTGIGISIAANKFKGIRCAHVTDIFSAQMCVEHNNANIMAMGGRITAPDTAYELTKTYLASTFEGGERHVARIAKIAEIEEKEFRA